MKLEYKSTGDREILEVDGVILFERFGCSVKIECDHINDLDALLELIDKCRSKQPEHLGINSGVLD